MNNESMRIDIFLFSIFFFPHYVEFKTCVAIKKLSLQLVFEPSTW